jgi:threonylcarbamoyladenosine tRNA methylthiotransferase MtaB
MAVEVVTFGCRLNAYESESMRAQAEAAGHQDLVIVNTCAVTAEATRQARQSIRKLAREHPGKRIVVTGCAAQVEPESFVALPGVTQVVGNDAKMKAETWNRLALGGGEKVQVNDIFSVRETALHLIDGMRAPAPSCRCRTAATTAARSASSLTGAGTRGRFPWERPSIRSIRSSSTARARWC